MKIFVGYDPREDITYQVCEHSIKRRNKDVDVVPLKMKLLRESGIYTREIDRLASTEFTFTRFFIKSYLFYSMLNSILLSCLYLSLLCNNYILLHLL